MDLTDEFGFSLSKKLQNLEISSEKILNGYLDQIEKINPTLNAIVFDGNIRQDKNKAWCTIKKMNYTNNKPRKYQAKPW